MAIIKFGLAVSDIRGSVAGTTFSSGTYGAYARRKAIPTNRNTASQGVQKSQFATLSSAWRSLTPEQRETWITQAPEYTRVNAFGDNVPLTGQALFMRCNLNLNTINVARINEAIPPVTIAAPSFSGTDVDLTAGTIEFDSVATVPANVAYVFKASNVVSGGKKYASKSALRVMTFLAPSTVGATLDIATEWQAMFGSSLPASLAGTCIAMQVLAISTLTGQVVESPLVPTIAHV